MIPVRSLHALVCTAPRAAAAFAGILAVTVIVGWTIDYAVLRSVVPGAVEMKANTAFGLLVSAVLLWVLSCEPTPTQHRWTRVGAALLIALGTTTLAEYAFGVNLGIDEAVFADRATAYNAHRGRMSPYTAGVFIALGLAFIALRKGHVRWLGRTSAVVVLVTGVVSTLGYLWNAQELVTDQLLPPVAINTALAMMLLAAGILVADVAPGYLQQREQGQLPVEGTIVLALVCTFVIFAAGASYTYRTTAHFDASLAEDEHLEHVRTTLLDLERGFAQALGTQRVYLARDTVAHAQAYARAADAAQQQLRLVGELGKDRRIDGAVVARLQERGDAFLASLRDEVDDYRSGKRSLASLLASSSAHVLRQELMLIDDPIEKLYADSQAVRRADARKLRQYTLASILMLLGLVAGIATLIVRSVWRDVHLSAETRRHDELSQSILGLLASTRSRSHALEQTVRLLQGLVPGSTVAFYATAGNGDYDREVATEPPLWPSHFEAADSLVVQALQTRTVVQDTIPSLPSPVFGDGRRYRTMFALVHGEARTGLIALQARRALKPSESSLLARLAAHLAVSIANLRHLSDLRTLSEQLARKNDALETQAHELERATRLKSEFLATMSHELRTPLNAIIGFAEVLKGNLAGELSPTQREYVGDILTSGEHLLSLINDILDLSKIEAGKMELQAEPLSIESLLQNSLSMVRERAMARGIRLELVVEPPSPSVFADARKLKQICYNLLSNAVKFSHQGGSVVVAAKRRTRGDSTWLEISVSDTGIGISRADQARLFQPFVQADSSLAKQYEGTGLGLALVKRLAELHGGRVSVESTPKMGSTFTVWLPMTPAAVEGAVPSAALPQAATPSGEVPRASTSGNGDADTQRGDVSGIPAVEQAAVPKEKDAAVGTLSVLQKPVRRDDLAAVCTALAVPDRAAQPCRVLVVDDEPMAGQILSAYFESAQCVVVRSRDGAAALAEAMREPPDLIVLDVVMPGLSGLDVVATLRADPRTAKVPVVIVTGKPLSSTEQATLQGQSIAVLEKGALRRADLLKHVPRPEGQEA